MRIFFSVGEPSGDLHAANLIKQLRSRRPDLEVVGFGGPRMAKAGCQLRFDLTDLAVMFLASAVWHLRTFLRLVADADRYFAEHNVDGVVLIDYPGLNWWIARKAKKHGIPVFYYGVPQVWAWAPWRIGKIKKLVDVVICKLPFEEDWFRDRGCQAEYVGHPYFDQLATQLLDQHFLKEMDNPNRKTVLLLPGSRDAELRNNLPLLSLVAEKIRNQIQDVRIVIGCLHERHAAFTAEHCRQADVRIYSGKTQELMLIADACVACSGSVSLELLYHRLPTVVVYKVSLAKMLIQAFVLRCKYISLPNLMQTDDIRKTSWRPYDPDKLGSDELLMPEYLTHRDVSAKVASRVLRWLESDAERMRKKQELNSLAVRVAIGGASQRAADIIINRLSPRRRVSGNPAA